MDNQQSYFEDEVQDGFFVPGIMKRCWASAKQIYDDLNRICREEGLHCSAAYGTLMGTIRHGGVIPWDDDVDVMMTRRDYQKLEQRKEKKGLGKCRIADYTTGVTEDMIRGFTNYENTDESLKEHCGFPFGDMIDVFIYDYVPSDSKTREQYKEKLNHLLDIYRSVQKSQNAKRIPQILKEIEDVCAGCTKEESKEQTFVMDWCARKLDWHLFLNEAFEDYIEMPFETGTITVPIGYDYILRKVYGNYMTPMIIKSGHNYPFFDELEKQLIKEYGSGLLRYSYDRSKVEEKKKEKIEKTTLQAELYPLVNLFLEAHEFVRANFDKENQRQEVLDTLGQCQELAIHMGESIEVRAARPEKAINILESYCEKVFEIYQKLENGLLPENLSDEREFLLEELEDYGNKMKRYILLSDDLKEKKEVVFLCYKPEYWKGLHSLWEKTKEEADTNVTVIAVPYYNRDYSGDLEQKMHVDTEGYPEIVTLTPYENYNFEIHHPDQIIYQFPYDEFSYERSLHPFFYVANLQKYTDEMVFVSPFLLKEIEPDDERSRYTLKWYLQTPGLIYADKILVQSEQMKEVYREILENFTGPDSDQNWGKKLVSEDFPRKQWEERSHVRIQSEENQVIYTKTGDVITPDVYDEIVTLPEEWLSRMRTSDGKFKKIILYYTSGSVLYMYREKAIQKIEKVIETAKNHSEDTVLIWRTDGAAKEVLEKKLPDIWNRYQQLREQFDQEKIGIVDESDKGDGAVKICDAFYGDAGILMSQCRIKEKPVLWQNPEICSVCVPLLDK